MTTYPLLDSQLGVILACGNLSESTAWNLPSVIVFDKTISAVRLFNAVKSICAARTELHIQFKRTQEGTIRQFADTSMTISVDHSKMSDMDADNYMKNGFVRPFILFSSQPLCRFEIVETEKRVLLLSDLHHSIADGFTIAGRLIGADLPAAYNGQTLEKPGMTIFEWALREQEEMNSPAYIRARSYFHSLFSDAEVTRLSMLANNGSGKGISTKIFLQMNAVEEWCAKRQVSSYHFLMAAFCLTLSKLSHQKKVFFCTLNHGRYDKRLSEAYGMFVNTIPFVADIDPEMTVGMLIQQIRKRLMDNHRHRVFPFTHFCSDMGVVPKITFGFQSKGILEQTIIQEQRFEGMQLCRHDSQSDLSVMVYLSGNRYEVRLEASDAMYKLADLERFGSALHHCISELMDGEDKPVGGIELVDQHLMRELMQLSAGEQTDSGTMSTIVDMFLCQAERTPDATAVDDTIHALTYHELDIQSRNLAHQLVVEGVKTGSFVGIDTTPCCEFLVAALAIMRTGGAYVPVDPHLPVRRRQHVIDDAGIQLVIDASYVRKYATSDVSARPINDSALHGAAYMIYTSGSTGMPKGVVINHAGLANLIRFCVRRWPLSNRSRIACQSSLAFDASVEDIFPVLSVGGCVLPVPDGVRNDLDKLALFLRQHKVTGGCFTTRLGVTLAETHPIDVDYYCLGGERLMSNPSIKGRVYNTYGPTEFTVDAVYFELEKDKVYDTIPIGRPLDNCHAFVVDPYGCLLPQGAVGELWLAGPQIADGYWNAPSLTEERFTTCSFFSGRVYHTGDLVRWNEDGFLEFVGRIDNQVKIDGIRVALEEIEQHLMAVPGIINAAAVTLDMNGKPQIQAFFTSKVEIPIDTILKLLREFLPPQMIPKHLEWLERMPLTASGKIDKRSLHADIVPAQPVAPADTYEWVLSKLMAQVLGVDQIGATDDFFAMGGTSLSAMQLVAEARKKGFSLNYSDIFTYPTPRLLSLCIKHDFESHDYDTGNYDYSAIHQFLSEDSSVIDAAFPNGGTMLLTGATGFLGIHILARFLSSDSWKVVCMVRGTDERNAWDRLLDRWKYYYGQQKFDVDKVTVVCGNLIMPSAIKNLAHHSFDVLVNCAADVRYFAKDNNIIEVNTKGVGYLAELCMETGARLIQISTTSIAGIDSSGNVPSISPRILYSRQRLMDQYSYSKFLAERMILQRMVDDGLKANIIRVGHLAPRSTDGLSQINASENMLSSLMQTMADLGGCPESVTQMEIEWMPVDEVADSIFNTMTSNLSRPVLHLNKKRQNLKTMADVYAGTVLPVWPDGDYRRLLLTHHESGIGTHLLSMILNKKFI